VSVSPCYIGLGSNLGDPIAQAQQAIASLRQLPESRLLACSSLYRSAPVLQAGMPPQPDYINAVAVLETCLPPHSLLDQLQQIEAAQGRQRGDERWLPRTLDLDILLYGQWTCAEACLTVPHPRLTERLFVLYPLYECAPDLVLPDGRRLRDILQQCPPQEITRLP
jgi:2-amino-4-hydroxy-6-hydroxymethyldihydropteridine diphosphokinase